MVRVNRAHGERTLAGPMWDTASRGRATSSRTYATTEGVNISSRLKLVLAHWIPLVGTLLRAGVGAPKPSRATIHVAAAMGVPHCSHGSHGVLCCVLVPSQLRRYRVVGVRRCRVQRSGSCVTHLCKSDCQSKLNGCLQIQVASESPSRSR